MCGNGIRVGKYMYDHGRPVKAEITVETLTVSDAANHPLKRQGRQTGWDMARWC